MKVRVHTALIAAFALSATLGRDQAVQAEPTVGRDRLIADARQLAQIIESVHPEPYYRGGGRIAFYRRLHHILSSIPEEGMTKRAFTMHVAPLVAGVGDGHTTLYIPYSRGSGRGGVPLELSVVQRSLYVTGVPHRRDRDLLGSLLVSVEGVDVSQLADRVASLRGVDNEYGALLHLSDGGYLAAQERLSDLVPEWRDQKTVRVVLQRPDGSIEDRTFEVTSAAGDPLRQRGKSRVAIPSTDKTDFAFSFIDDAKRIAMLRVDGMMTYREAYELNGTNYARDTLRRTYRRFNGTAPPADFQELLEGVPSATETFKALVEEMKSKGTETLIVDVRQNQGGVSLMTDMLIWFLFGKDEYLRVKKSTATDVVRLSNKYFAERPGTSLASVNQGQPFEVGVGEYDLRFDCAADPERLAKIDVPALVDAYFRRMPTFYTEYASGAFAGYYRPEKIVVLCDAKTFSGGYGMMWWLHRFGATIVGTPSAQAGNAFLDILTFRLDNTGLEGQVSTKYQEHFPGDPDRGHVLRPDHELTYEYLASTGFDPNAAVLLALEKLGIPPS